MNMRTLWTKLQDGDQLETVEMEAMMKQAQAALPFLMDHPDTALARRHTLQTSITLEGYLRARETV